MKTSNPAFVAILLVCSMGVGVSSGTEMKSEKNDRPIFTSVFWVGADEDSCVAKNSLYFDSFDECEEDFPRAEKEIKETTSIKNSRGANLKWGVFHRCSNFASIEDFENEYKRLEKKCSGKKTD